MADPPVILATQASVNQLRAQMQGIFSILTMLGVPIGFTGPVTSLVLNGRPAAPADGQSWVEVIAGPPVTVSLRYQYGATEVVVAETVIT